MSLKWWSAAAWVSSSAAAVAMCWVLPGWPGDVEPLLVDSSDTALFVMCVFVAHLCLC